MASKRQQIRNMEAVPEVCQTQPGLEISREERFPKFITSPPTYPYSESQQSCKEWLSKSQVRRVFRSGLLLGILIATTVVGAILGGALGAKVSSRSAGANVSVVSTSSSSTGATSSVTSAATTTTSAPAMATPAANYSALRPAQVDTLFNDCKHDVQPTSPLPDEYVIECGIDYGTNRTAHEGGQMLDIIGIITYSFLDCLNACADMNQQRLQNKFPTQCRAISWSPNLKDMMTRLQSNCWLKNGTLADQDDREPNPVIMSARLKTP